MITVSSTVSNVSQICTTLENIPKNLNMRVYYKLCMLNIFYMCIFSCVVKPLDNFYVETILNGLKVFIVGKGKAGLV